MVIIGLVIIELFISYCIYYIWPEGRIQNRVIPLSGQRHPEGSPHGEDREVVEVDEVEAVEEVREPGRERDVQHVRKAADDLPGLRKSKGPSAKGQLQRWVCGRGEVLIIGDEAGRWAAATVPPLPNRIQSNWTDQFG
jgi:hypothetical protein